MDKQMMIYETGGKNVRFNLAAGEETLWATQAQMAELFDVTPQNVTTYLQRIYKEGELEQERTCKQVAQVQSEGEREVVRTVKMYNLDAVIAVGYRVNSRKATDFRIWATNVLRKYIVEGLALNERRLGELPARKLQEVEASLGIVRRLLAQAEFAEDEAKGIAKVITQYAQAFRTLKEYDEGFVRLKNETKARQVLEAGECTEMINQLRESVAGGNEMFGKPRGDEFEGILRQIYQSFDGEEVYPTVGEKAANLLYFIIKDHPFFDGNKRIAAMIFMAYLTINGYHLTENGDAKVSEQALVALTLMIAKSDPREKGLMTAVVCKVLE